MNVPSFADLNLSATLPAVFLALGTTTLLIVDVFLPKERRHWTAWLALLGVVVSFVLTLATYNSGTTALSEMFVADSFSGFMNMIALVAAGITVLLGIDYMKRRDSARGEFWSLLLLSTAGIMFMASLTT